MLESISSFSFRDMYQQLIYIEDEKLLNIMKKGYQIPSKFEETGILAYAYVDEEQGLCFNIFSLVKMKDQDLVEFNDEPMKRKLKHKLKLEDIENSKGMLLDLDPDKALTYMDRAKEINLDLAPDPSKVQLRLNTQIDPFRHRIYPDDFESFLYDPKTNKSISFWVRGEKIQGDAIIASILTPLPKEYGYALEDMIDIKIYEYRDSLRPIHVINS
ncbi:MAG: hypothetical protein Q4E50_05440 [Tissierellia bacterium]|nr:hypothetical protein [Tissierellia bacterium]